MVDQEPAMGIPGKTGLTDKESRLLNRFSEPDSRLWKKQYNTIDRLRLKYPDGSPAQETLDIFDHRTGVGARNTSIANQALKLRNEGDIQGAEELMKQLR